MRRKKLVKPVDLLLFKEISTALDIYTLCGCGSGLDLLSEDMHKNTRFAEELLKRVKDEGEKDNGFWEVEILLFGNGGDNKLKSTQPDKTRPDIIDL